MHDNESMDLTVVCARGAAGALADEIRELGYTPTSGDETAVTLRGTWDDIYRLNLRLFTAQRVLALLNTFAAPNPPAFYRMLNRMPWEEWLLPSEPLCVSAQTQTPTIRDTRFAVLKAKDAIVDRLRDRLGVRPDIGELGRSAVVWVRWIGRSVAVYLDTSGERLGRRGYRREAGAAPMQESLAAALLLAAGWQGEGTLINPMCGSGTLAIEAALMALNRAPGLLRESFAFQHLRSFQPAVWNGLRREAAAALRPSREGLRILATDRDPDVLRAARANAKRAGVDHAIDFETADLADTPVPPPPGLVIVNPEYGRRMGQEEALGETYRGIGDFLKQRCTGYRAAVFTGNLALAKQIGLRSSRRLTFFNGPIESRLLNFELYAGSRKHEQPDASRRGRPDRARPPERRQAHRE